MQKRTFSISQATIEHINDMAEYFHVNMQTILRFAIVHMIEYMNNGYYPFRYKRKKTEQSEVIEDDNSTEDDKMSNRKIDIFLPEETWIEFCMQLDKFDDEIEKNKECTNKYTPKYTKEHIPEGEIVDYFIKIELKRLMKIHKEYEKSIEVSEKQYSKQAVHSISVKYDIPEFIYEEIQKDLDMTGLSQSQIGKYLLLKGILAEYENLSNKIIINTDADFIEAMDKLNLDRGHAATLLQCLLQSGKIMWVK